MDECVSKTFEGKKYCRVQDFFRKYASSRGIQGKFSTKPPSGPILHLINPPKYFRERDRFIMPQTRKFRIRESGSLREIGISVRTLQTYRDKGLLPYSCIKHKIFYKPEDVEAFLKSSYHQQNRAE